MTKITYQGHEFKSYGSKPTKLDYAAAIILGLSVSALLVISLVAYATWRDNSMTPIEDTRDDCEVVRTEPHKTVRCGGPAYRKFPGHTTL